MQKGDLPVGPPIGHVLVIAGPSAVGKSTLASRLFRGETPGLLKALELHAIDSYRLLNANKWRSLDGKTVDVVFHYDLTRPKFWTAGPVRDAALDILDHAQRITFLTLWDLPEEIERRLYSRASKRVRAQMKRMRLVRAWKTLRRVSRRRRLSTSPRELWAMYRRWFEFTSRFPSSPHWVLRYPCQNEEPIRVQYPEDSPMLCRLKAAIGN